MGIETMEKMGRRFTRLRQQISVCGVFAKGCGNAIAAWHHAPAVSNAKHGLLPICLARWAEQLGRRLGQIGAEEKSLPFAFHFDVLQGLQVAKHFRPFQFLPLRLQAVQYFLAQRQRVAPGSRTGAIQGVRGFA